MSIYDKLYNRWYLDKTKHELDNSDEAFEEYINGMSNVELLREISDIVGELD